MPLILNPKKHLAVFGYSINPEPWAMGEISIRNNKQTGKVYPHVGPNVLLVSYKQALRASLFCEPNIELLPGWYSIRFTFSRQLARYMVGRRTLTRNWSDVTNLQKGTEDALQEAIIDNDRNVIHIESGLFAEQKEDTPSWVVGEILYDRRSFDIVHLSHGYDYSSEARSLIEELQKSEEAFILNNEWTP